jgi:tetratricopeptide (TPR) repeat protein
MGSGISSPSFRKVFSMAPLSRSPRTLGLLTCFLLTPAVALACLWDSDTLKQERYHFPETLELVTGKFLRHSKEFYEWRIQDRVAKLKSEPKNLTYLDDLAVAYEKVGDHDKAIETILKKEEIQPGIYETYSNLGTFYILTGEFEKGLPFIDKALAINPDAHFGSEKYQ